MPENLCSQKVNRGNYRWPRYEPCGRIAVEDGLCKMHLRVRDKRMRKDAEYYAKVQRGNELQKEAERLTTTLGIDVRAYFDWRTSRYTEHVVVPLDWIQQLAKEIT